MKGQIMRPCYVAGRYRVYREDGSLDLDAMVVEINKERAAAIRIAQCGLMPFCPLANSVHIEGAVDWDAEKWIKGDLIVIKGFSFVQGAVYMRQGWDCPPASEGATKEYDLALRLFMPVICGGEKYEEEHMISLGERHDW